MFKCSQQGKEPQNGRRPGLGRTCPPRAALSTRAATFTAGPAAGRSGYPGGWWCGGWRGGGGGRLGTAGGQECIALFAGRVRRRTQPAFGWRDFLGGFPVMIQEPARSFLAAGWTASAVSPAGGWPLRVPEQKSPTPSPQAAALPAHPETPRFGWICRYLCQKNPCGVCKSQGTGKGHALTRSAW